MTIEQKRRHNRRYLRQRYREDPEWRLERNAKSAERRKKKCAADPEYHRLVIVRGTIAKVRNQIEAHMLGLEQKKERIGELEMKLFDLIQEKSDLDRKRKKC